MSAYRRDPSDPTKDFFLSAATTDERHESLWLFKGGPDFGSKRLYLDSPSYFFWHPSHYDGGSFNSAMPFFNSSTDMGDMTGTGNPVLCARGILPVGGQTCLWGFYVLGDAMDDKIDMFFTTQKVGWPIPITADNDNMTDAVLGMPFICSEKDKSKGWEDVGSIGLLHGSKKIPVHLNDVASDTEREHLKTSQMYAYPNPLDQKTTLTFENCTSGVMYMEVVSSIGVSVLREEIPDVDGLQQYAADLSGLPAGAYHIRLVCPADGWSASTNVIKTGAIVAPWSLDLRKMMGR